MDLLKNLKETFGFSAFRPYQEDIIKSALNGHDVFALLPTGGGKSLCFQLPSLIHQGLTVVISPLISLMKDQVDSLQTNGVPATFLNSSLKQEEARKRLKGLHQGQYRLLYVAPERLFLAGFLDQFENWKVKLFAIDEAHCISEWGHDFRPEYRQLGTLRKTFPNIPMMAFTATATGRVQEDIVKHLKLKKPHSYQASFNRPNLTYRVLPKEDPYYQLLTYVKGRPQESGIVYCQSRASTENLASRLEREGIAAKPYHAGLTPKERNTHQDLFLRDEIRVICATIAFGMGINKSNVRFVLHYDLPKNIEGYYQETGRAGRDGLASDCLLFFRPNDVAKIAHFIEEKPNPAERQIASQQLTQMVHFAETSECRRKFLLRYFGEDFESSSCMGCDNCLSPRPKYDGTLEAQKFLSCVYRIRERSGFSVGMKHIVDVLLGGKNEKIRQWNHQTLSTYGIGQGRHRREWHTIGEELHRLGYLQVAQGPYRTLQLTENGYQTLTQKTPVQLTRPLLAPKAELKRRVDRDKEEDRNYDETLFQRLRKRRKKIADDRSVPAYIVFSDATLREMARKQPLVSAEFSLIGGVGKKKLEEFGEIFIDEIHQHQDELADEGT